jgi:hypothetical protein
LSAKKLDTRKPWANSVPLVQKLAAVHEKPQQASEAQAWVFANFDGLEVQAFVPEPRFDHE